MSQLLVYQMSANELVIKEPAKGSQCVGAFPSERPLYYDRLIVHHGN